jgi:hypothetical protein
VLVEDGLVVDGPVGGRMSVDLLAGFLARAATDAQGGVVQEPEATFVAVEVLRAGSVSGAGGEHASAGGEPREESSA